MVDGCGWWAGRSASVACWLVWFVGWLVCITHQRVNQPTEHTNKQPNQPTHHQASQPSQSNHANHTTQPSHTPTPTNHKHERTRSELRARSQCRETGRDLGQHGRVEEYHPPHRNETPHRPPPPPRLCARRLWSCKNERGTLAFRARFQSRKNAIKMRRQLVSHECSEIAIARWFRDCLARVLTTQIAPSGPHATRPTPCSAPRRGCVVLPSYVLSPRSRPWRQQSCWWR